MPVLFHKLSFVDQNSHFLMGEQFTLGDAYLLVIVTWLALLKIDLRGWPSLLRYYSDLKQRPSIYHALDEESLLYQGL